MAGKIMARLNEDEMLDWMAVGSTAGIVSLGLWLAAFGRRALYSYAKYKEAKKKTDEK